jgi:hypothetical protein
LSKAKKHGASLISSLQGLCNSIIVSNVTAHYGGKINIRMEQIKSFLGLTIIVIYLIYGYETVDNEIRLNRIRRIIRGHLAKPGQVTKQIFSIDY